MRKGLAWLCRIWRDYLMMHCLCLFVRRMRYVCVRYVRVGERGPMW